MTPDGSRRAWAVASSPLWALLLLLPWALCIALGDYGTNRSCVEGHWDPVRLPQYPSVQAYCAAYTREWLPGAVRTVTRFFGVVAVVWVVIALLVRLAIRRSPTRS